MRDIHETTGVTVMAFGGQPSNLSAEYFVDDLRKRDVNLQKNFYLFSVTDYDPAGWIVRDSFISDLKFYGMSRIEHTPLGRTAKPAIIEGIEPPNFIDQEKELLLKSKSLMPKLPTDQIDVLIVDEMGKDVSGTGMDTNIIGRYMVLGVRKPENPSISRIYVRQLTEASHGNATGLGLADFTHQRLLKKVNLTETYVNILNGTGPEKGRIPPCFSEDLTGLQACFASIAPSPEKTKLIWIKNTMELSKFYASQPLINSLDPHKQQAIDQKSEWIDFSFNEDGNFPSSTDRFSTP